MIDAKSNPKPTLRMAEDDGLKMLRNETVVRLRREFSRRLVELLFLTSSIHLAFACPPFLPQAAQSRFFEIWI